MARVTMNRVPRAAVCAAMVVASVTFGEGSANAQTAPAPELKVEDVHLEGQAAAATTLPEAPLEAPPLPPRKKGFVLEGALGALGFLGQFRRVAPTAPWLHLQFGYEFTNWLMLFAEGELAFSDTSVASGPSQSRAFPIFGLGLGPRFTLHLTERVGVYAQGQIGVLKADVPKNSFAILGYRDAESLGLNLGARVGVEWYQMDRHMALGLAVGVRDAKGFAKYTGASDTPLMWDGSLAIRYTF
jgi:hypothetical protein